MRGLKFIYNPVQALYYEKEYGLKVIETDVNPKTGKRYWAFNWDETIDAYKSWINRKH